MELNETGFTEQESNKFRELRDEWIAKKKADPACTCTSECEDDCPGGPCCEACMTATVSFLNSIIKQ